MMGTADELPQEPAEKVVFMEDMTDEQLASAVSIFKTFPIYFVLFCYTDNVFDIVCLCMYSLPAGLTMLRFYVL